MVEDTSTWHKEDIITLLLQQNLLDVSLRPVREKGARQGILGHILFWRRRPECLVTHIEGLSHSGIRDGILGCRTLSSGTTSPPIVRRNAVLTAYFLPLTSSA